MNHVVCFTANVQKEKLHHIGTRFGTALALTEVGADFAMTASLNHGHFTSGSCYSSDQNSLFWNMTSFSFREHQQLFGGGCCALLTKLGGLLTLLTACQFCGVSQGHELVVMPAAVVFMPHSRLRVSPNDTGRCGRKPKRRKGAQRNAQGRSGRAAEKQKPSSVGIIRGAERTGKKRKPFRIDFHLFHSVPV